MKLKKRYLLLLGFLGLMLLGALGYYATFKDYNGRKAFRTGQKQIDQLTLSSARNFIKSLLSAKGDFLYIKGYHANIRRKPSLKAAILLNAKHNTYCEILGQSKAKTYVESLGLDYWYKVRIGDTVGWVFGKLVALETDNYPQP